MRRKDRERSEEFGRKVIEVSDYAVVTKGDYSVPLSLALERNTLYGHGAMDGEKWNHFLDGESIRAVFVTDVHVPHPFKDEEIDGFLKEPDTARRWLSKIFTTHFSSAIVEGTFHFIEEDDEKIKALHIISKKYMSEKEMELFDMAAHLSLDRTRIFKIDIESITAKQKNG